MYVRLKEEIKKDCNNPLAKHKQYGRLNYPEYLFELEFTFVNEFEDKNYNAMITVNHPQFDNNCVLIKDDCIIYDRIEEEIQIFLVGA